MCTPSGNSEFCFPRNGFVSDGDEDDVIAVESEEPEASESAVISEEEAASMVAELKGTVKGDSQRGHPNFGQIVEISNLVGGYSFMG